MPRKVSRVLLRFCSVTVTRAGRCWYYIESESSARKSLFTTVIAILWQACTRHRFMCCLYALRRRKILLPLYRRRALMNQTLSGVQAAAVGGASNGHLRTNGYSNGGTHLPQQPGNSSGYGSENEYLEQEYLPNPSPLPPGAMPSQSSSPAARLYPELPGDELLPTSSPFFLPPSCLDLSKQRYGGAFLLITLA